MPLVTVAKTTDLPPGAAMQVAVGDRKLAVFNLDGVFCAIEDVCTHRGAPLSEGAVIGEGARIEAGAAIGEGARLGPGEVAS